MKTHRDCYPEQYLHPLCGCPVRVVVRGEEVASGVVSRVINSRYGELAVLEPDTPESTWWRVLDCTKEGG